MNASRRDFLGRCAAASAATWLLGAPGTAAAARRRPLHIACNSYVWHVFYQREKRELNDQTLDQALAEMKSAGIDGYEPGLNAPADVEKLAPLLRKNGLEMRSVYVNSTLHDPAQVERSLADVLAIARAARDAGCRIVVTNPSPIRWAGPENKDDRQLELQADAMNRLGLELKKLKLQLAYHNHDIELRNAAREFHHMLAGTRPDCVHLCLDAHWVYRGAGNSAVALFDVVKLYGKRVCELHLRQSRGGVWSETMGAGDIDYPRLAQELEALGVKPHLVLEQAVENGTPHTMDVVAANRATAQYVRRLFGQRA